MAYRFESFVLEQVAKIVFAAREVVVYGDYFVAVAEQSIAQMGAQEAGAPGH